MKNKFILTSILISTIILSACGHITPQPVNNNEDTNNNTQFEEPKDNIDETTNNTSTYENAELGYKIDYPSDWVVNDDAIETSTNKQVDIQPKNPEPFTSYITILVDDRNTEDMVELFRNFGDHDIETTTLAGQSAYLLTYKSDINNRIYLIPHNNKTYQIETQKYDLPEVVKGIQNFKFINDEDKKDTGSDMTEEQAKTLAKEHIMNLEEYKNGGYHLEEIGTTALDCEGCYDVEYEFRVQDETTGEITEVIDVKVEIRDNEIENTEITKN